MFLVLTIRPGHDWGGDFALYIAHAINISNGTPYADTGFIFNPLEPFMSPKSYPPVYPLFLAPVYKLFGLNLYAMKIAGILVFAVFLLLFYHYVSNRLESPAAQVMVVASMAFSPWFWEAKDRILPDFIFILFLYSSIMLMDRMYAERKTGLQQYLVAVGVGLIVYLLYGTRSLGMLIIPALFFHDIIRRRLISRTTLIVTTVFALFYFSQNAFLQTDQSYFESFKAANSEAEETVGHTVPKDAASVGVFAIIKSNIKVLTNRIPRKLYNYGRIMSTYWYVGDSVIPGRVLFSVMTTLAIAGFLGFIIKSPSVGDFFILTYVIVLLVVPFEQSRYMLPLVPLYMLYIFHGADKIKQLAIKRGAGLSCSFASTLPVVVFAIIAGSYVTTYSMSYAEDFARGVEGNDSRELFDFIRENTPEDSIFVFHRPRPIALFTGRRAVVYHWDADTDELWRERGHGGNTYNSTQIRSCH